MRTRAWVRSYFGFSRVETNGFLVLMPLCLLFIFARPIALWLLPARPMDPRLDSLSELQKKPNPVPAVVWHRFDPNSVDSATLSQFGLDPWMSRRWVRYRLKGGKFRHKEDVLKITGLTRDWYDRAVGWMEFAKAPPPQEKRVSKSVSRSDINVADSLALIAVRGVGPSLSRRIRVYRDRLGGFVSMFQLHEVYGLDSNAVDELRLKFQVLPGFVPHQLSVNESTREDLAHHPYIGWTKSKALVLYRFQHGSFSTLDELRQVRGLDSAWVEKVRFYLKVE